MAFSFFKGPMLCPLYVCISVILQFLDTKCLEERQSVYNSLYPQAIDVLCHGVFLLFASPLKSQDLTLIIGRKSRFQFLHSYFPMVPQVSNCSSEIQCLCFVWIEYDVLHCSVCLDCSEFNVEFLCVMFWVKGDSLGKNCAFPHYV